MVKLKTMHTSNHLWGELDDPSQAKLNLNQGDKDLLTRIPRPLSLEGPRIHQPKIDLLKPIKSEDHESKSESYVFHGVQLLTYINQLHKIKESALARRERGLANDQTSIPPLPPLSPQSHSKFPVSKTPFQSFDESHSPQRLQNLPILINSQKAHKSLKKSVAALTAFHGYEMSTDQALDVLTDATSQFLTKFCSHLRQARDKELRRGSKCGFPDVVCRVYQEMGLGSILNIRSYYKNCIVAKHKAIGEAAETLAFECHHLDEVVQNFTVVENGMVGPDDPDNIPEIHFPSSEEGDNGSSGPPTLSLDHNAPQIETGLQMLQSLEQYGSLDPTGSVMVTPPPPSAHSVGMGDDCEQPMSHDSNAALLLATVSPGSSTGGGGNHTRKRRKTSDNRNVF